MHVTTDLVKFVHSCYGCYECGCLKSGFYDKFNEFLTTVAFLVVVLTMKFEFHNRIIFKGCYMLVSSI